MIFKGQLISKDHPNHPIILAELDGVLLLSPLDGAVLMGMRSSSLPRCFIHTEMSVRQSEIRAGTVGSSG